MKNYHYCVHLAGGDQYYSTLAEAKRQAKNIARAAQGDILVTREPINHAFNPDHNLYCVDCGAGELAGNHGMIPGPEGCPISDGSVSDEDRLATGNEFYAGLVVL